MEASEARRLKDGGNRECTAAETVTTMQSRRFGRRSTSLSIALAGVSDFLAAWVHLCVAICGRSYSDNCSDSFIVRVRVIAFAITRDGQMPSSLILAVHNIPLPLVRHPDVETTGWRARRGKTAQRLRREKGAVIAVFYSDSISLLPNRDARHALSSRLVAWI